MRKKLANNRNKETDKLLHKREDESQLLQSRERGQAFMNNSKSSIRNTESKRNQVSSMLSQEEPGEISEQDPTEKRSKLPNNSKGG